MLKIPNEIVHTPPNTKRGNPSLVNAAFKAVALALCAIIQPSAISEMHVKIPVTTHRGFT
jgi:hypothetical protein